MKFHRCIIIRGVLDSKLKTFISTALGFQNYDYQRAMKHSIFSMAIEKEDPMHAQVSFSQTPEIFKMDTK